MPSTTSANLLTVVHKGSNGISFIFPDVCKTPAAPSPIPIPYPNIAMSKDAAKTANSVKSDGNPIMVKDSKYAMSTGDEAGSLLGVVSNKVKGSANPTMFSMDVKAEGKNIFRQFDLMLQNGNENPTNTATGTNVQAPKPGMGANDDYEKFKIKKVEWSHAKCKCGDPVKISTETENMPNGMPVEHAAMREDGETTGVVLGEVNGDKTEVEWLSVYGSWRPTPSQFDAWAYSRGPSEVSSNKLKIEVPPEKKESVNKTGANRNPKQGLMKVLKFQGIKPTFQIVPNPKKRWASSVGYDISLKKGKFLIHCKVALIPADPKLIGKRWRKVKLKAERQIRSVWHKKMKFHRWGCERKEKCRCPEGCCLFPIRIHGTIVIGGGHVYVHLHPGPPSLLRGRWWNSANWYERDSFPFNIIGNPNPPYAHEFGHNIGMEDEYPSGATIPAYFSVPSSIMGGGRKVMEQHFTVHNLGGVKTFLDWFEDNAGDLYRVLPM